MTEDEAKTKWCAHAVASHTNPRSGFDDGKTPKVHACIGSACMAWRWDYAGAVIAFDGMIPVEQLERMKRQATPQHGFCGLAGKP